MAEFASVVGRGDQPLRYPLVQIDRGIDGLNASTVKIDNRGGARMAMEHFYEHGYEDILLLIGDAEVHDSQERLQGSLEAAAARG